MSDAEDAFDFIGSFIQYGWKGIQNEYRTIADLGKNGAGHGYLPDYLFIEGFEEARKSCPGEITDCLFPGSVGAAEIAIVWED